MILQPLNCATPRYTRIGLRFAYKTPANFRDRQKVLKYGGFVRAAVSDLIRFGRIATGFLRTILSTPVRFFGDL
jgi:hypothetical protein